MKNNTAGAHLSWRCYVLVMCRAMGLKSVLGDSAVQQFASVGHRTGRSSNSWIISELLEAAVQYGDCLLGYLWQGTNTPVLLQQL